MFESDSDSEFVPAVLQRPKVANHIVHETFTVDTRDHEDHSFCGIMFEVRCRAPQDGGAPVEFIEIASISVRGSLGPLTVWKTENTIKGKENSEAKWDLIYEQYHGPSRRDYQQLEFTSPIRLAAGERCGLYVHSKLPGDSALVYDNKRSALTYEDEVFQVFPGLAHLSNTPFGRRGMWGFPWRDNREFVGRINYGVGYTLWNPEVHSVFPLEFRDAVKACLLSARRQESPLNRLQDEVVLYILNMCKYDWFSVGPRQRSSASNTREGYRGINNICTVPSRNRLDYLVSSRVHGYPGRLLPHRGAQLSSSSSDSESEPNSYMGIENDDFDLESMHDD